MSEENMQSGAGKELGRNEPCHCGSGKKYKRCHGVGAAPKLTAPKSFAPSMDGATGAGPAMPGGFDPSKLDPQMMTQFSQALARLPKGQLQKLQSVMQRAMSGKDVSREAAELERTFPAELQQMMIALTGQMHGMAGMSAPAEAPASGEMTEEEARKIVAAAAAEGKITEEKAQDLLSAPPQHEEGKKGGIGKLWRGITGK